MIIITLTLICFFLLFNYEPDKKHVTVSSLQDNTIIETLQKENDQLKGMLSRIVPDDNQALYTTTYRLHQIKKYDFQTSDLPNVLNKGTQLDFTLTYNNPNYKRPVYDSNWKQAYYRGWLRLADKIDDAYHDLFVYYGGASNISDFEGNLGFFENLLVDYHRNVNFLVYSFHVDKVILYNNQIVLIGIPLRDGAEIVSIEVNDILPTDKDSKDFLFQLSTPAGYEVDYLFGSYYRSDYLKRLMEEEKIKPTFAYLNTDETILKLREENALLKHELSYYIPLEDNLVITDQNCRNDSSTAPQLNKKIDISKATEISYDINYHEKDYRRPLYDPIWKTRLEEGLCYMPTKIYEALHDLFVLPEHSNEKLILLENLGFHQEYTPIPEDKSGLLMYHFLPNKVMVLENELIIIGTPTRTGASIISIDKKSLSDTNMIVKLLTPDLLELDYETLQ